MRVKDKEITVSCPECGRVLFKGRQSELRNLIVYCERCA